MQLRWIVVVLALGRAVGATPLPPLAPSVSVGQLWFADPACRAAFPNAGEVSGAKLDQLDACLEKLDLQPSDRSESLDDRAAYTYGPGFELETKLVDGKLTAISFLLGGELTVASTALEGLRIAGALAIPRGHAWAEVCVDELGRVASHAVREASSIASARAAELAIDQWDFAPFRIAGRSHAVCALEELRAANALEDPLPITPPQGDELVIASSQLVRVAGEKHIEPDDVTKVEMMRSGWSRIEPAIEVCIDPDGAIERIELLHSSGLAAYDNKLEYELRDAWRFRPYREAGQAISVCTVVHFVYTQN